MPLNSPIITGDVSGGLHTTSVDKLKGQPVAAVTPRDGEVLTWNGEAWVPGAPANGGSGGGGVAFYFNGATAAQSPTTGLPGTPVELGRVADTALTTITSGTLSQADYTLIKGFVSDVLDPGTTTIPAGLWDFNLWAASNATQSHQTIFRLQIFKYDGANAPTLLATSDDVSIYDPTVAAQYIASVVVPQTTILATDRIYIEVQAKATANNRTITIYTGDAKPSHVHTTIPSVTGTGLVKVISSVIQSPASLLVDADVDAAAAIAQSKIANLTTDLNAKAAKANVQVFTTVGTNTWTKPDGARVVEIHVIGGGGGGGSGCSSPSGTAAGGGAGGGGGGRTFVSIDASFLGPTETVTVGAAGTGGASRAAEAGNGINGTAGTASAVGLWVYAGGGSFGGGGTSALTPVPVTGGGSTRAVVVGGSGGAVASSAGSQTFGNGGGGGNVTSGCGGGAGGGVNAGGTVANGGVGGFQFIYNGALAGGTPVGQNGFSVPTNLPYGGSGGGGGNASKTTTAMSGGNGGLYGAGGGGGGAGQGFASGAGGNGAQGIVVVTTYF
jgi:hypothetical protein